MDADDIASHARMQRLKQRRARLREEQAIDLMNAARVLVPAYGAAVSLGRIAVQAGLSRHIGQALFNGTPDLVTALIRCAWHDLTEAIVPPDAPPAAGQAEQRDPGAPRAVIVRLLAGVRADAAAHVILRTAASSLPPHLGRIVADAEDLLVFAVGESLRLAGLDLRVDQCRAVGRRVLALARDAALDRAVALAREPDRILAMVHALLPLLDEDVQPASADRRPAPALRRAPLRPSHRPPNQPPPGSMSPDAVPAPPGRAPSALYAHDPPARDPLAHAA